MSTAGVSDGRAPTNSRAVKAGRLLRSCTSAQIVTRIILDVPELPVLQSILFRLTVGFARDKMQLRDTLSRRLCHSWVHAPWLLPVTEPPRLAAARRLVSMGGLGRLQPFETGDGRACMHQASPACGPGITCHVRAGLDLASPPGGSSRHDCSPLTEDRGSRYWKEVPISQLHRTRAGNYRR
jgi:hypothetical protein